MKRGFTLMELLIVVSIIGILAGLSFPAFLMVRRQVDQIKCSNNLQQIAVALEVYRQDHNDRFPYRLYDLVSTGGYAFPPKAFLCPADKLKGTDAWNGRNPSWPDYRYLYDDNPGLYSVRGVPCSYDFEASSNPDPQMFPDSSLLNYFYRDKPDETPPQPGVATWADAKQHQQKFGNLLPTPVGNTSVFGAPFPASALPILRCYHHEPWAADYPGGGLSFPKRVNNVSLEFNVFWSIPHWELQANPNIPEH